MMIPLLTFSAAFLSAVLTASLSMVIVDLRLKHRRARSRLREHGGFVR